MSHSKDEFKSELSASAWDGGDDDAPPESRHQCDFGAFLQQFHDDATSATRPSDDVLELMRWISHDVSLAGLAPCAPHAIRFTEIGPFSNGHRARFMHMMGLDSLLIQRSEAILRLLARYYATLFSTSTMYVSFPKFFAGLMRAFDAFQKSHQLRESGFVYCLWIDSYKKSSMWVTLLLLYALMCPTLGLRRGWIPPRFLLVGFTNYAEQRVSELPRDTLFVVVDDASYSGSQLASEMDGFAPRLQLWNLNRDDPKRRCCLVVPYVSKQARIKIRGSNLTVYTSGEDMPSVNSAFKDLLRLRESGEWKYAPSLLTKDERDHFFGEDLPFLAGVFYNVNSAASDNPNTTGADEEPELDRELHIKYAQNYLQKFDSYSRYGFLHSMGLERFAMTPNVAVAFFADLPFGQPSFGSALMTRLDQLREAEFDNAGEVIENLKTVALNALQRDDFQDQVVHVRDWFVKIQALYRVIEAQNQFESVRWTHTLAVFEHRMADSLSVPHLRLRAFLGVEERRETRLSYMTYLKAKAPFLKALAFRSENDNEVGYLEGVGASVDMKHSAKKDFFAVDATIESLDDVLRQLRVRK